MQLSSLHVSNVTFSSARVVVSRVKAFLLSLSSCASCCCCSSVASYTRTYSYIHRYREPAFSLPWRANLSNYSARSLSFSYLYPGAVKVRHAEMIFFGAATHESLSFARCVLRKSKITEARMWPRPHAWAKLVTAIYLCAVCIYIYMRDGERIVLRPVHTYV